MKKKTLSLPSKLSRQFTATARAIEGGDGSAPVRYSMSVSSEQPYLRYGFGLDNGWYEVLSHEPGAIDMSRADGMPLLLQHDHAAQVGVVETIALNDSRQLAAEVRFSRSTRGAEIEQDVADGIRRNVSIGYQILEIEHTGTAEDGLPILTATRWMPFEVSSVSVPADHTVGMGRAAQDDDTTLEVEVAGEEEDEATKAKKRAEGDEDEQQPAADAPADGDTPANPDDEKTRADGDDEDDKPKGDAADTAAPGGEGSEGDAAPASTEDEDEKERKRELTQMATAAGQAARAADFITRGLTPAQAGKELLALRRSIPTVSKTTNQTRKESLPMFSFKRAIQVALGELTTGIEADFNARIAANDSDLRRHGPLSVYVPLNAAQYHRALDTKTDAAGGATIFEQQGEFIDLWRNRSLAVAKGARVFTNLRGNLSLPKLVGGAQTHWVAENPGDDVDESQAIFSSVTLAPKTIQATTAISRQLLNQSSLDVESIIKDDLAQAHALAIDKAVFHGQGGLEPVGIYNAAGVAAVDMSAGINYGKLVDMVTEVAAANALNDSPCFVTNPRVAGRLAQTLVAQSAGAGFIWDGKLSDGIVAGYDASCSNQLAANLGADGDEHALVFANLSDAMIGMWGVLEIVVDPYSLKKQGLIEVTTFQQADVALRHGASFAKATGLKLAA